MSDVMVSVAMVTYNHSRFIGQALDSILKQKINFKIEIVIGDDCSLDNTQTILQEYKDRYPEMIKLILRKKNIGAPANYFDVIHHCKGKYISQLEGDDFWTDENKLQIQVDFLNSNPDILAVAHQTEIVNIEGVHTGAYICKQKLNRYFNKFDALKYHAGLWHPSSILFRNFIFGSGDQYSIIKDSNRYGSHSLMIFLLACKSNIYIMDRVMSAWRCVIEENGTN